MGKQLNIAATKGMSAVAEKVSKRKRSRNTQPVEGATDDRKVSGDGHKLPPKFAIKSVSIDVNKLAKTAGKKQGAGSSSSLNDGEKSGYNIEKVSRMLRDVESNKQCYNPLVVSIGPYHRGDSELESGERLKAAMARRYMQASGGEIDFHKKVEEVAADVRNCYSEASTRGLVDKDFAEMLLVDTCFVIQYILDLVQQSETQMKSYDITFLQRDLFLLENQLPFMVVEALMSLRFQKEEILRLVDDFMELASANFPRPDDGSDKIFSDAGGSGSSGKPNAHLLGILHSKLVNRSDLKFESGGEGRDWSSYRSAYKLKAAGILFKPNQTHRLTDIEFKPKFFGATLSLPRIAVDETTKSLLLNLAAYESSPSGPDDCGVASYICFMASLIDQVPDVTVLRFSSILLNYLGNDQKVVEMFDDMAKHVVPNPQVYVGLTGSIEKHYRNKTKVWFSEWLFSNFSILAFVAATITIVLSFIQTYFTAFPRGK